jgi:hypothetical protein
MATFIQLSDDTAQSDGANHMTPIVAEAPSLGPCCDAGAPDIIRDYWPPVTLRRLAVLFLQGAL